MERLTEKDALIKASLIAGLTLFSLPNYADDKVIIKIYADKFDINLKKFKRVNGSGLLWNWDPTYHDILPSKISERVKEQSEYVCLENMEECIGNSSVDDFEYVFCPDGTGFTGYMDEFGDEFGEEGIFMKHMRYENKLYTYYGETGIHIYEMDIDTQEEAKEFIKKLMEEKNGKTD